MPSQTPKPATAEAIGLIVIALLILAFVLLRYGGNIAWGAK